MKEIVFVTHNKGKIKSAERYLKDIKVLTYNYELDEPRSDDITEIATAKVKQAYKVVKKPCIAMDAGFFIKELNGFPRAFVNFALDTIGLEGILKLMEDKKDRSSEFKECIAYFNGKELQHFYGVSKGKLSDEILGIDQEEKWSDLWYIFIPEGYSKTLAEMTQEERNNRKRYGTTHAMEEFSKWYLNKDKVKDYLER